MTVIKRQRSDNFAVIPNEVANDARLSFDARGLLVYLLAKPNDWYVSIADLMKQGQIGRDKTYRLLNELIDAGYVQRSREQDESGRVTGFDYTIFDVAVAAPAPLPEKQEMDEPLPALPDTENQDTRKKELTSNKTPPNPPQAGGEGFAELVKSWPRDHHGNLDNAGGSFRKLSAAHQGAAVRAASSVIVAYARRKTRIPALAAYLRKRIFLEFDDAPPIDPDGAFIITPDRHEWGEWLGWIRKQYGQRAVDDTVKRKMFLPSTRWPEGHEKAAA